MIILFCYNSILAPYSNWLRWYFKHSVSQFWVYLCKEHSGLKCISYHSFGFTCLKMHSGYGYLLQGMGSLNRKFLRKLPYVCLLTYLLTHAGIVSSTLIFMIECQTPYSPTLCQRFF